MWIRKELAWQQHLENKVKNSSSFSLYKLNFSFKLFDLWMLAMDSLFLIIQPEKNWDRRDPI